MSNYTKSTNFAAKDSLPSGNANKVVKGTEINTEFDNIATAITSKADLNSPTLVTPNLGTPSVAVLTNATGLPLTTGVTGTLPVANGGTGATTFSAGALLKGAGTSAITTATAGTDYAAATTGTSAQLLANNGSGGFSNVTVGSGLSLSAGTLSTSGGASISAGDSNVTVSDTGSNGTVTVQTDGSERMRITNTGNLLVGTTTNNASGGVIQVSNGITFPATQSASSDANTLDDYEEGTWTVSLAVSSASSGPTSSSPTATYTKIGRLVHIACEISYSGSVMSGVLQITGLPFSAASTPSSSLSVGSIQSWSEATPFPPLTAYANGTRIYMTRLTNAAYGSDQFPTDDNGGTILIGGCYYV